MSTCCPVAQWRSPRWRMAGEIARVHAGTTPSAIDEARMRSSWWGSRARAARRRARDREAYARPPPTTASDALRSAEAPVSLRARRAARPGATPSATNRRISSSQALQVHGRVAAVLPGRAPVRAQPVAPVPRPQRGDRDAQVAGRLAGAAAGVLKHLLTSPESVRAALSAARAAARPEDHVRAAGQPSAGASCCDLRCPPS